jgi:hypothetical protein
MYKLILGKWCAEPAVFMNVGPDLGDSAFPRLLAEGALLVGKSKESWPRKTVESALANLLKHRNGR